MARILPWRAGLERWVGSSFTSKHYTRLIRLAKEKHSSLLDPFVSYEEIVL
jgi:hypothetical protein